MTPLNSQWSQQWGAKGPALIGPKPHRSRAEPWPHRHIAPPHPASHLTWRHHSSASDLIALPRPLPPLRTHPHHITPRHCHIKIGHQSFARRHRTDRRMSHLQLTWSDTSLLCNSSHCTSPCSLACINLNPITRKRATLQSGLRVRKWKATCFGTLRCMPDSYPLRTHSGW